MVAAVRDTAPALPLLGLGSSAVERAAASAGLPFLREAFVDRGYRADGTLVPRGEPGDLLTDPAVVAARAVRMVLEGAVTAASGEDLQLDVDSLCVHGDTPGAVAMAEAVRAALSEAGVTLVSAAP